MKFNAPLWKARAQRIPLIGGYFKSSHEKMVEKWNKYRGEELRYKYPLNKDSVVFDVGGYKGDWSTKISLQYSPFIYIFEPVAKFSEKLLKLFRDNKKVQVYGFGLSGKTKNTPLSIEEEKSSAFKKGGKTTTVKMVKASDFIKEHNINHIGLMKINIEGGEYELIENLIAEEFISKIDNIQVQFHSFVPKAKKRMETIQKALSETHYPTYQYKFVRENRKRKEK